MTHMKHWPARLLFCAAATLTLPAWAAYPDKPVTVVSPYGAGGAADLAARTLANHATAPLGQPVVAVIKAGAAGVTGSTFVARSPADGYTLLLSRVGSQAAVPALNRTTPYKWDDFTFLGLLELNPFALTVNADSPYQTLADLKKAVAGGKKLSYSSAGVGALQHLGMVTLLDQMGLDQSMMRHVPFKGGGAASAAVLGGHVDVFFQNLSGVISHVSSGKLRALAISTDERSPDAPDVPTFAEQGLPGMNVILGWSGLWGPKDLPDEVVAKWVQVLGTLKADKGWQEATMKLGSIPKVLPPAETKAFVQKQFNTFSELADRLGLAVK